jgi:hypothetical protein
MDIKCKMPENNVNKTYKYIFITFFINYSSSKCVVPRVAETQ